MSRPAFTLTAAATASVALTYVLAPTTAGWLALLVLAGAACATAARRAPAGQRSGWSLLAAAMVAALLASIVGAAWPTWRPVVAIIYVGYTTLIGIAASRSLAHRAADATAGLPSMRCWSPSR